MQKIASAARPAPERLDFTRPAAATQTTASPQE
jgi:hypothetical protein